MHHQSPEEQATPRRHCRIQSFVYGRVQSWGGRKLQIPVLALILMVLGEEWGNIPDVCD